MLTFPNTYYIEFVGKSEPERVRILDQVVNGHAHILYLIGDNGTVYNWSTIIKMTKIKEN